MRKILICGSRNWSDRPTVRKVLRQIKHPCEIIHGNAQGADKIGAEIAAALDFSVTAVFPDWERYGKSAGLKRNIAMLEMKPEIVIAFWDGKSRGTQHTITQARQQGIPVLVVEAVK